ENEHLGALRKVSEGSLETIDAMVVAGGMNGAGMAEEAAGRGLSGWRLGAQDLACATSSGS
ncbi:glycerol-3-phosphate dehydrogenase, partial [Bacillus amyloliquefaciens]|nr:glycerol-3-phosphate dehydrogenase [Bacillus amyloliquefaciens]